MKETAFREYLKAVSFYKNGQRCRKETREVETYTKGRERFCGIR